MEPEVEHNLVLGGEVHGGGGGVKTAVRLQSVQVLLWRFPAMFT